MEGLLFLNLNFDIMLLLVVNVDKPNQDVYTVVGNLGGQEDYELSVVFDGHGWEGEICVQFEAKKSLELLVYWYVASTASFTIVIISKTKLFPEGYVLYTSDL